MIVAIAWRNLWRNRRRTWLTAGAVAFACLLLLFSRSLQLGGYKGQVEATTALIGGHLQIQDARYLDDPRLEYRVDDANRVAERAAQHPDVEEATLRSAAFALLSVGERSFGAQLLAVLPDRELRMSSLPRSIIEGRYLQDGNEVILGSLLARNLGAGVGDELVVLGTAPEGGVAALALDIVGVFETGQTLLDRALAQLPLSAFDAGFYLQDSVSYVMLQVNDVDVAAATAADIDDWLPAGLAARPWQELLPDVVQGIALDRISARMMYAIITLIVLFSIVNTFIMNVFERTPEFGMLLAVGMRPLQIIGMLQLEALWLALIGGAVGALLSVPMLYWLVGWGIPLGELAEMTTAAIFPSHMKGGIALGQFALVPLVFVLGCQFAALAPGLRLLRMKPTDAMRSDS